MREYIDVWREYVWECPYCCEIQWIVERPDHGDSVHCADCGEMFRIRGLFECIDEPTEDNE